MDLIIRNKTLKKIAKNKRREIYIKQKKNKTMS